MNSLIPQVVDDEVKLTVIASAAVLSSQSKSIFVALDPAQ